MFAVRNSCFEPPSDMLSNMTDVPNSFNSLDPHLDFLTSAAHLKQCTSARFLWQGKFIHACIIRSNLHADKGLQKIVVEMYSKCDSVDDAKLLFYGLPPSHAYLWNLMIGGFVRQRRRNEVLCLFRQMQMENVTPDRFTFGTILSIYCSPEFLEIGRNMQSVIVDTGLASDVVVGTALVKMFGKCGSLKEAEHAFVQIDPKDLISWNSMLTVYAQNEQKNSVFQLFQEMQLTGVKPNIVTFVNLLDACVTLFRGKLIHSCIICSRINLETNLGNALVNMYGKCGSMEYSQEVYVRLWNHDIITWNTMIANFSQNNNQLEALLFYKKMLHCGIEPNTITVIILCDACASLEAIGEGKKIHAQIVRLRLESNVMVGNAVINMYAKCHSLDDGKCIFNRLIEPNVVTWTTLISACVHNGHGKEALHFYRYMLMEGMEPNDVTLSTIVDSCTCLMELAEGKKIHASIIAFGTSDVTVSTSLINMYGKCADLTNAERTFNKMGRKDVIAWSNILVTYSNQGYSKESLQAFQQMQLQQVTPNKVTCASVIDACTGLQDLAEGKQVHAYVVCQDFESDIVISSALLTMYSKFGSLECAEFMFSFMRKWNLISWNAMMAAYVHNGHAVAALKLFRLMQLEGETPDQATFITLLDGCAIQGALIGGRWIHAYMMTCEREHDISAGNALVNMYSKCGSIMEARCAFQKMVHHDIASWNVLIAANAHNGDGEYALETFKKMQCNGINISEVAITNIFFACSHSGFVDEGCHIYLSLIIDYHITPTEEHCGSFVDLLGRFGKICEGEDLVNNIICKPSASSWMALLGAYKIHL